MGKETRLFKSEERMNRSEVSEFLQLVAEKISGGQVFRYLRGAMEGRIIDLTYTDASELYHQPEPTWVAAALMAWQPLKK
jgi:hypothetical protein